MDNNNLTETGGSKPQTIVSATANYALNGKIMLTSVLILFFVIFSIVFFRRRRRRPISPHSEPHLYLLSGFRRRNTSVPETVLPGFRKKGVDPSFLASLPTFLYPDVVVDGAASPPAECAVCLSDFDPGDKLRALPKCRHAFHAACIDAWFRSRSNCPLCRSPVAQPDPEAEESPPPVPPVPPVPPSASSDVRVQVPENDPGANEPRDDESGSSERCQRKPRRALAGLGSRDDQTGLGEPNRNRVMVKCSLKRFCSI